VTATTQTILMLVIALYVYAVLSAARSVRR
jgi:hypothetical protein